MSLNKTHCNCLENNKLNLANHLGQSYILFVEFHTLSFIMACLVLFLCSYVIQVADLGHLRKTSDFGQFSGPELSTHFLGPKQHIFSLNPAKNYMSS